MIPLFTSTTHEKAIHNVIDVLHLGWTGLGLGTERFEKAFAEYVGAKYAIGFNSGTAALRAAVISAQLPKNSYVITTPLTFVSTNHVILQAGLRPLFADIELYTGNIDVTSIAKTMAEEYSKSSKISAIMAVHYGGIPVDLDGIYDLAGAFGLTVIQDCAHACGASYKGTKIGGAGTYNCFSFHAVKNLPTGDGGMITTDNKEVWEFCRKYRWLGIDKSTSDRNNGNYSWEYNCEMLGEKSHMNDIQAALGLGQLEYLDKDNAYRQGLVDKYSRCLTGVTKVTSLVVPPNRASSNHLMVILADNKVNRDSIISALNKAEIQYGLHYKPSYYYPVYHNYRRDCPTVEEFYTRAISLPLHLKLSHNDVHTICDVIKDALL